MRPLIIPMTGLHPSRPDQTDAASHATRQFPSGSVYSDAEHLPRN
jgi:hypothetical protein